MKAFLPSLQTTLKFLTFPLALFVCQSLPAAVGLTVTPTAVSSTYDGNVTLQVTGLSIGETVVVQKFLDVNTNSAIDNADILWQQFQLTDGQASVIGGVTNINVPGDTDATPGVITAKLDFQIAGVVQTIIGRYAYKLSSPTGLFAPLTNWFTVTNVDYGQSLSGNVVNSGTNVPNALVVLLEPPKPGDNGPGTLLAGTVAGNSGSYAISVPTGAYVVGALKDHYLGDLGASPVTVGAGTVVTANLTLSNTTRTISGRLTDASNHSVGLPGLLVHVINTNGLAAVANSDTNGEFTVRVASGIWGFGEDGVNIHGYLSLNSDAPIDTTTGDVSGLIVAYPKATALFYGSVKDQLDQPVPGVRIYSSDDSEMFEQGSATDSIGNYAVGALGGETWEMDIDSEQLSATNYLFSDGIYGMNLSAGQTVLHNFTAILAPHHITGHVQDGGGTPLVGVRVYATGDVSGSTYETDIQSDVNGNYSLDVVNGNWNVGICCSCDNWPSGLCCPNSQSLTISNANGVANFTASGQVSITTPSPLPEGFVDHYYSTSFQAMTCGSGGYWSATNLPSGLDLSYTGMLSGYPDTPGSNYFTVRLDDYSGSYATRGFSLVVRMAPAPVLSGPSKLLGSQFGFTLAGIAGQNYTIQKSTNLNSTNWTVLYVTNAPGGVFQVMVPLASNGSAFYRVLFGP